LRESGDVVSAITLEALTDGVAEKERISFRKEIQEALAALAEADVALG
jgi:hypothetical protein